MTLVIDEPLGGVPALPEFDHRPVVRRGARGATKSAGPGTKRDPSVANTDIPRSGDISVTRPPAWAMDLADPARTGPWSQHHA